MQKLKLRWVLPVVFLGFSAIELIWSQAIDKLLQPVRAYVGSASDFWHALNAPALFLVAIALHYAPLRAQADFNYVPVEAILFLVGGFLLWFLIGNRLDEPPGRSAAPSRVLRVLPVLIFVWGIYLCWQGLHTISTHDYLGRRAPGSLLNGALVIIWSMFLMVLTLRSLAHALQSRAQTQAQPGTAEGR